MKNVTIAFITLAMVMIFAIHTQAQIPATINIQGVLRASNGTAVADGPYTIVFKLYDVLTGGTAQWTETQEIEVTSGIYNAVLGAVNPFSDAMPPVTFDKQYFLEVVVTGKALQPRVPLTPAPYALSLLGDPNTFPSSGAIRADGAVFGENLDTATLNLSPQHSVLVKGGVLASGGAGAAGEPGADGTNNNGYAFQNDKDSGLFSTGDGKVALYTNDTERLLVTNDTVKVQAGVEVTGNLNVTGDISTTGNLNLSDTEGIRYVTTNDVWDDWRLVETDYFENNDADGWQVYNPTGEGGLAYRGGWNQTTGASPQIVTFSDDFAGKALVPTVHGQVFKKQFTLPQSTQVGAYTYVKVVFNYYFIDSWSFDFNDQGYCLFAKTVNGGGTDVTVTWTTQRPWANSGASLNYAGFWNAANFYGLTNYSDHWVKGEAVVRYPSGASNGTFWVMFGATLDEVPANENFGVGHIEVWVK